MPPVAENYTRNSWSALGSNNPWCDRDFRVALEDKGFEKNLIFPFPWNHKHKINESFLMKFFGGGGTSLGYEAGECITQVTHRAAFIYAPTSQAASLVVEAQTVVWANVVHHQIHQRYRIAFEATVSATMSFRTAHLSK
jgi:hypothetical protein